MGAPHPGKTGGSSCRADGKVSGERSPLGRPSPTRAGSPGPPEAASPGARHPSFAPTCLLYGCLLASSLLTWLSISGFPGQPDAVVDLFLCLSMYAFCPKFPLPSCPPTVSLPSLHCMEANAKTRNFCSLGQDGTAVQGGGNLPPESAGAVRAVRGGRGSGRQGPVPPGFSVWSDFVQGDIGHCLETFLVVTTGGSWHVVGRGQGFC